MAEVNLENLSDEFAIHYGGQLHSVEAGTFANSIVALSKIIEEINYYRHPNCSVEIRIEALSQGSFRPKIKLYAKSLGNFLSPYFIDKKETIPVLIALFALFSAMEITSLPPL